MVKGAHGQDARWPSPGPPRGRSPGGADPPACGSVRSTQVPGGAVGRPSASQACIPPTTSVARTRPSSSRLITASCVEQPSSQSRTTCWSGPVASGILHAPSGSSRHSSTLRPTTTAPGTSPSRWRWSTGRVSTRRAPACRAAQARPGSERCRNAPGRRRAPRRAGWRDASLTPDPACRRHGAAARCGAPAPPRPGCPPRGWTPSASRASAAASRRRGRRRSSSRAPALIGLPRRQVRHSTPPWSRSKATNGSGEPHATQLSSSGWRPSAASSFQ